MRITVVAPTVISFLFALVTLSESCSKPEEKILPASHTVEIKAMQFQPAELFVRKGDTVTFLNRDIVVHDVTEQTSKAWASSPLSTGQSFRMVINNSEDYYCTIHPVMKGKISVRNVNGND
jgi:plastocyanin